MQQHRVPQNVTTYEFHIIGKMTIKQFLEVGAGVGVAVFFYATNLPAPIKVILITISVIFGAAAAFLPVAGRPFDRMLIAFFKAVYSPTQFLWKKSANLPDFLSYKSKSKSKPSKIQQEKQKVQKSLSGYLETLPDTGTQNKLDEYENKYLFAVNNLFQTTPAAKNITPSTTTTAAKQNPKPRPRKLKKNLPHLSHPIAQTIKSASIKLPPREPLKVTPNSTKSKTTKSEKSQAQDKIQPLPEEKLIFSQQPKTNVRNVTTSIKLPFPTPPENPNTLVGMVLTTDGKIVENAIIEVRDKNQIPVRALKSNKLGQFFSATKLPDGHYEIDIEKPGLNFDIVGINLKGKIVQPLEIRALSKLN